MKRYGIRTYVLLAFLTLAVALVVGLGAFSVHSLRGALESEMEVRTLAMRDALENKGERVAGNVALACTTAIAGFDMEFLRTLVRSIVEADDELLYACIIDRHGRVLVQSEGAGARLEERDLDVERISVDEIVAKDLGAVVEIVAPIRVADRPWGSLHLGYTLRGLDEAIAEAEEAMADKITEHILTALLVAAVLLAFGVLGAIYMSRRLTLPVTTLAKRSRGLTRMFSAADESDELKTGTWSTALLYLHEAPSDRHAAELDDLDQALRQLGLTIYERLQDLKTIGEATKRLLETRSSQQVYEVMLELVVRRLGCRKSSILVPQGNQLSVVAHHGWTEEERAGPKQMFMIGEGLAGLAAKTRKPVWSNDIENDDRFIPSSHGELQSKALLCVPLVSSTDDLGGVVNIHDKEDGSPFTATDARMVQTIVQAASITLARTRYLELVIEFNRGLEEKVVERTSELKAAYERLQNTQRQLVQSEKLASLGQLVAGVAHELNNPINFVYQNVDTLAGYLEDFQRLLESYDSVGLPDAEKARIDALKAEIDYDLLLEDVAALLKDVRTGAERSKRIVQDLRTFSRLDTGEFVAVDIHAGIETSLNLLQNALKDRVTIHRDFQEIPVVRCRENQLNQVFLNLLNNAQQAIDGSGNIWIQTQREDDDVVIRIRDDGRGMSEDVQAKLFDPFFTTKDVGEGTGLGLSISYGIVEQHSGSISFESAPNEGTEFTIRVPIEGPSMDVREESA